ncbi:MAG: hypothetical protein DCE92_03085 [Alphaproteobacteria bacterium]|nr:MAG: hypothetical protein DCE92_03085 [Alphaproteobacteria bacterium]
MHVDLVGMTCEARNERRNLGHQENGRKHPADRARPEHCPDNGLKPCDQYDRHDTPDEIGPEQQALCQTTTLLPTARW